MTKSGAEIIRDESIPAGNIVFSAEELLEKCKKSKVNETFLFDSRDGDSSMIYDKMSKAMRALKDMMPLLPYFIEKPENLQNKIFDRIEKEFGTTARLFILSACQMEIKDGSVSKAWKDDN